MVINNAHVSRLSQVTDNIPLIQYLQTSQI